MIFAHFTSYLDIIYDSIVRLIMGGGAVEFFILRTGIGSKYWAKVGSEVMVKVIWYFTIAMPTMVVGIK